MPIYSPQPQTCAFCGDSTWTVGQVVNGRIVCGSCFAEAARLAQRPANTAPVHHAEVFNGPGSLPPRRRP
jgi:hypothetical protein